MRGGRGEVDTLLGQESLEETKLTVFLSHCEKRKKRGGGDQQSMIVDAIWKSFNFLGKSLFWTPWVAIRRVVGEEET